MTTGARVAKAPSEPLLDPAGQAPSPLHQALLQQQPRGLQRVQHNLSPHPGTSFSPFCQHKKYPWRALTQKGPGPSSPASLHPQPSSSLAIFNQHLIPVNSIMSCHKKLPGHCPHCKPQQREASLCTMEGWRVLPQSQRWIHTALIQGAQI